VLITLKGLRWCPKCQCGGEQGNLVWAMSYCGCIGYEVLLPANQLGGLKNVWDLRDYGLCEPWVNRESTVRRSSQASTTTNFLSWTLSTYSSRQSPSMAEWSVKAQCQYLLPSRTELKANILGQVAHHRALSIRQLSVLAFFRRISSPADTRLRSASHEDFCNRHTLKTSTCDSHSIPPPRYPQIPQSFVSEIRS